jgi:hypothetical protein
MLKCRDIAERASDYIDGHLSLNQRLAVLLHLLICGHCRAFVRQLRLLLAYYRHLPPQELAPEEAAAIAQRAAQAAAADAARPG